MQETTTVQSNRSTETVVDFNEELFFISANTEVMEVDVMKKEHIIPVHIKDNEPVISHSDFIDTLKYVAYECFRGEEILEPLARVSHPIKGRIPEARKKPAKDLLEHEKTLYYERMAFYIEIPSISREIDGNKLSLCIGGVKAHNLDQLYSTKGTPEVFKVFIGFQNKVCLNLCVSTDGVKLDLRVNSTHNLMEMVFNMITDYNADEQLGKLQRLTETSITESQFAHMIGRCRMYQHLSNTEKAGIPVLPLTDSQISQVVNGYYRDPSFAAAENGGISLWRLYNLLTGANKSSYIDKFVDRSAEATEFMFHMEAALTSGRTSWFLQ